MLHKKYLFQELSEEFETSGYLLTSALRTGKDDMDVVYDLVHVNYYLDFMHIMTYDYHGAWDGVVGANAPIYGEHENDIYSIVSKNLTEVDSKNFWGHLKF